MNTDKISAMGPTDQDTYPGSLSFVRVDGIAYPVQESVDTILSLSIQQQIDDQSAVSTAMVAKAIPTP